MKITRYKKVQKYLRFYCNNFSFRRPYHLLVDGTFCFAARNEQINIREQLPKYLSAEVKLLTTRCIIIETEKIAKKTHGALTVLKQFGIHECNHKEPIPGAHCILSMIGKRNDNHYILASQDRDLQEKMRKRAGVPLLYLHGKSPTLEKPSKLSYEKANVHQEDVNLISNPQNETLHKMKQALGIEVEKPEVPKLKKKKVHNPNPLSCKKKKRKMPTKAKPEKKSNLDEKSKKVRKRHRNKLPAHVKEQLKSAVQ